MKKAKKENRKNKNMAPLAIVGIGASAGGLAALKTFFSIVPEDSGLTFVIIVHLSPEHKSVLAELLQPHVKMPVEQVTETVPLQPNHVYVIPPNANLNAVDTHLRLSDMEEKRRERAPIDHFFRTLAKTHDGNSIGIILTGTGSDGALGLKEIKMKNGLTIVQDPYEAEFDGMPQSAIATGVVDVVLPLSEIPPYVIKFAATQPNLKALEGKEPDVEERQLMQKIYAQVRARTGRDFSRYKLSTIMRRLQRRMQLHQVEHLEDYLDLLRKNAEEVKGLSDDFLINVTSFFRDQHVFQELEEKIIPKLFESKKPDTQLRVWSVGCATGEEAYSLAMLLMEEASRQQSASSFQVFASDLHEHSLTKAREGFYPGDIEVDVSSERLRRFFTKEDGGYRIRKELREQVIFTPHNLLGDPPFSRIDLIVCRNLLIYLKRDSQRDIFELFHYALQPNGYLLLGPSEHLDSTDIFRTENKELSLYAKRNVAGPELRLPVFPKIQTRIPEEKDQEKERITQPYGALHQKMVEHYAPPSLLLSPDHQVLHVSETAGRYLRVAGGELSRDVFRLVRPEIQVELRTVIFAAREKKKLMRSKPLPLSLEGQPRKLIVSARVIEEPSEDVILVMFEEYDEVVKEENRHDQDDEPPHTAQLQELERELEENRQRLHAVIEEYETSREEMKASNEEQQSANEELRSTLEELETSKEELQSVNEELTTLNQENRHKVEELGQLSDDLQNLLAATDIATLFLDKELRIMRFTPKLGELFNVRLADRGRPISDQTHKLGYNELAKDARKVLQKLVPLEREVKDHKGNYYLTRILPYRSSEDRIEGVVITFVDITSRKQAEEELQEAKIYAESIIETLHEPLLVLTPDLRVKSVNEAFYTHFEVRKEATVGKKVYDLGNGQWNIPALKTLLEDVLPENNVFNDFEVEHYFEEIGRRVMLLNARRLDHVQLILLGIRDITEKKEAEEVLRRSEEHLRLILESAKDFAIFTLDKDKKITNWNIGAELLTGFKKEEIIGQSGDIIFVPEDRKEDQPEKEIQIARKKGRAENERWHLRKDGSRFWGSGMTMSLMDGENKLLGFLKIMRDNTERKQMETSLMQAKEQAEKAARAKEEFLSTMSHEIRTPLNAINGLTNLLLKKAPRSDQRENLNTLKFSTQSLLSLVNDILDYSRIEAGKVELEHVDYSLSTLLNSIRQAHSPLAEEKHNVLYFHIAEDVPDILRGDPHKLAQVLNNLVSNDIKFTEKGSIRLEVSQEKQIADEVSLLFAIKDNGIGISEKKLSAIFDKFTQADSSTVRRYGGTGLGLSITKSLLQLMGSDIAVESKEGEGSNFYFTVRQHIGSKENIRLAERIYTEERVSTPWENNLQKVKILLVEDADINRIVIQQHLQEWWELKADEVTNGKEAVEKARQTRYNLILMDKRMPEMDGVEATRRIRALDAHYAQVPIIIITADTNTMIEEKKEDGSVLFNAQIAKPFEPEQLMKAIVSLVDLKAYSSTTEISKESNGTEADASATDLFKPDFAKAEKPFQGSTERKQKFYTTAINSLQTYQTDFLRALEQEDAVQLENIMHKAKMLFNMLGLENFYQQMFDIRQQIGSGISAKALTTEITEIREGLEQVLSHVRIRQEGLE